MANSEKLVFRPDWAIPPGATLKDLLESLGMSQAELAQRMERSLKHVNEIIKGKTKITPETAVQLEKALGKSGPSASFWLKLESNYQEALARQKVREALNSQIDWLGKIPYTEMVKKGWIDEYEEPLDRLEEALWFFGAASPSACENQWLEQCAQYRKPKTFESDPVALAAWLRKGELDAQEIECEPYNEDLFRKKLDKIRGLTQKADPEVFVPALQRLCAEAGVAVVFTPQLSRSRASGATRWLNPKKALIQLSLRYGTNDHLWFTFFHEAGHILLHGKREIFLHDGTDTDFEKDEEEANRFAADILIPPKEYEQFLGSGDLSTNAVIRFAQRIGIAPGIVVGRLQHDKIIRWNQFNKLKCRYRWAFESD